MLSFNNQKCRSVTVWYGEFIDRFEYSDYNGEMIQINLENNLLTVIQKKGKVKRTILYPNPIKVEVGY